MTGYRYLPAIRADLLRRQEAVSAYTEALHPADNEAERRFLESRIDYVR